MCCISTSLKGLLLLVYLAIPLFCVAEQKEEGFRWRHSVRVPAISLDLEEMCRVERTWSAFLKESYRYKNLATAKIGMTFTVDDKVYYLSRWFYIPKRGKLADEIPIFVSGYKHVNSQESIFAPLDSLLIESLRETTIKANLASHTYFSDVGAAGFTIMDRSSVNDYRWFENLRNLYTEERDAGIKRIHQDLTLQHLANQTPPYNDFDKIYAHSEQWFLYHLQENIVNLNVERLCKLLPAGAIPHRVVLLVHTNRDACAACTQTISIFARRLQQYTEAMHLPLKPLVIVSSRTGYLERRFIAGHDGHARDSVDVNDPADFVKHVVLEDFPIQITRNTLS